MPDIPSACVALDKTQALATFQLLQKLGDVGEDMDSRWVLTESSTFKY